jgi:hypothetical protein
MKALYIAVIVILIVLLAAAVWQIAGGKGFLGWREHFDATHMLTISWAPPATYPFPGNLAYNWAYCMNGCTVFENTGICPNPLGNPLTWTYHGTVSSPSLTLNAANCNYCGTGCKGTLMLQAVDTVTKLAGIWVQTTIDLSYPAPKAVAITDASGQPLAEGSTEFTYTLSIDPSAFATGNKAMLYGDVLRTQGTTQEQFSFGYQPFGSVAEGVATFTGSLTSSSLWTGGKAPGPLQVGDTLTIEAQVYNPGKDGLIYYWGSFMVAAQAITPGGPVAVSWELS